MFNDAAFTITAADKLEPSSPITVSVPMSSDNNDDQLCSASKPSFHSLRITAIYPRSSPQGTFSKMSFGRFNSVGSDIRQTIGALVLIVIYNVQPLSLVLRLLLLCLDNALQPQELPDMAIVIIDGAIS